MSKPPSIRAAIRRLRSSISDSPWDDLSLVLNALKHIDENIEHVDDADMNPIYTIKLDADWRAKGFLEAVAEALENDKSDDEEEENHEP